MISPKSLLDFFLNIIINPNNKAPIAHTQERAFVGMRSAIGRFLFINLMIKIIEKKMNKNPRKILGLNFVFCPMFSAMTIA